MVITKTIKITLVFLVIYIFLQIVENFVKERFQEPDDWEKARKEWQQRRTTQLDQIEQQLKSSNQYKTELEKISDLHRIQEQERLETLDQVTEDLETTSKNVINIGEQTSEITSNMNQMASNFKEAAGSLKSGFAAIFKMLQIENEEGSEEDEYGENEMRDESRVINEEDDNSEEESVPLKPISSCVVKGKGSCQVG